jgi:large subunit ribosomal protein L24
VVKKHTKPNPMAGTQGGIVEKSMPIHQSNVAIFNAATGKADRVGIKILADGGKVRVFKSSGEEIKAA